MPYYNNSKVEKPYELISFGSQGAKRDKPAGHQALESGRLSGRMKIYLFPRVPVQVASGSLAVVKVKGKDEVIAQHSAIGQYDEEGKARKVRVLPGSSLKGALRSLVETLSPSCVLVNSRKTRSVIPHSHTSCTQVNQLCPACRLFGMTGAGRHNYQGQVSIEDAILERGGRVIARTPLLWTPARDWKLPPRYLKDGKARGRKLYYHSQPAEGPDARFALKTGSQLQTLLHFQNLTPGELGLLITAWGLHPAYPFLPKIGAAKPVGRGTVEVYLHLVQLYGGIQKRGRLGGQKEQYEGQELQTKIADWTKNAKNEGLLLDHALHDVHQVLKSENLARSPVEEAY